MEKDMDIKLYKDYLNGEKKAFELLYLKYKRKIEYFVFNIVKDYQKAEDITQEVFVYIMKNEIREGYSFKYYIFLVAKSKALNYLNTEKRRSEINENYIFYESEKREKDALEIITREETKKELLENIEMLDEKYKNAMFLVKIEELSYKETAEILGESVQNVKNFVHRGKSNLRKILIKKGFDELNKVSKILIIIICITVVLSGIVYATTQIIKNIVQNKNITFNPTYQSTIDENTINNLWIGTFDLAWKELAGKIGKDGKIELVQDIEIANELNNSKFTKEMISKENYSIEVKRTLSNGYTIYATLRKNLTFLYAFDNFSNSTGEYTFGKNDGNDEIVEYFGIYSGSQEKLNDNVEVLFYNKTSESVVDNDFAIMLKTQEGDEIIIYRTDEKKSFNEYYIDIQNKTEKYKGEKAFKEDDELLIPHINLNGMIKYTELIGADIKNTNMYIEEAVQNVKFSLNEKGCNLGSKATMIVETYSFPGRCFWFKDTFIIFLKEKNIDAPYFALKVDNTDILVKKEENNQPQLIDYSATISESFSMFEGEYKFYEDENYKYYYPIQKTQLVKVFYKEGNIESETVEEALKNGRISIDLLDKYEIEYIKRKK